MWTPALSKALGVVASAPTDWTHPALLPVFSSAAVVLGVTTSTLGSWVEKVGPRTAGMVGSTFWSGALLTTAAGIEMHALPLVYAGYGVLGGIGWGLMYLTPVTAAMKWFPDRRGLATGIALSAFGAGAALAPGIIHSLMDTFAVAPDYIGDCLLTAGVNATGPLVDLTTLPDGSQAVAPESPVGEPGTQVVVATEADIAKSAGLVSTGPGVYAVGTGDTGAAKAMASLGVLYGALGVAPEIVTPAFSTGYVSALGVGMALGRFGWSAISDVLGRRNTYALFGLGVPIVGMAPYLCHTVVDMASGGDGGSSVWPYLGAFYGGSVLAITFYGGIFSVLPAYIADLFGQKHAGAVHGKALTAWASSAVAGPMGLAYLRSHSYDNAIQDLLQTVDANDSLALERSFGVSVSDEEAVQTLIDAKTLTIEKLLELAPAGTVDPTPFLYDTTLYAGATLMTLAFLSNLAIRPLDLDSELQKMEAGRTKLKA
ncbi:hypothetical protein ACHAXT_012383 [Thalassiosira profunda]